MKQLTSLFRLAAIAPSAAYACAGCACATPVLTSMGTEQPLSGRVRVATAARAWSDTEAAAQLRELRFDLLASWSPSERSTVLAALPLDVTLLTGARIPFAETRWGMKPGPMLLASVVVDL